LLQGGRWGRRSVIPGEWTRDILRPDPDTVAAFAGTEDAREFPAGAYYRNQFWVVDPHGPVIMCSGINGQTVLVHAPAQVVVAKLSTWPEAWTAAFGVHTRRGLVDLAEQIADGRA
jgi:hypothetical protein